MGSRGRSIRLRIYFLVAIPLITMLGLFGFVAYSSVTSWLNQDRAPSLIDATSEPLTNFVNVLQSERLAAMVYLSQPDAANLAGYNGAIATTKKNAQLLAVALNSSGTKDSSTPAETAAIAKITAQINGMTPLRDSVTAKKLSPLGALADYTNIIAGQGTVLQAEASSISDAAPALQGFGLISAVDTQEDVSEQEAVLASALVSGSLTGPDRVAFSDAAGRQQDDTLTYQQLFTPAEVATYTATLNQRAPTAVQQSLTSIQQAVAAGLPLSDLQAQGLTPASWQTLASTWLKASSTAGTATAVTVLTANAQPAVAAKQRVWITAAVGVAGLILTLLVTILLGRSINRRLTTLRRSALTLAQEQLPAVVTRLRRGESVDVAAEAPPLRAGNDEIGQVGEAIDLVRQTAIKSAVEESRVRQGVNDMFRNLARRNQSLLQRQLTVLDDMERRATDPDVLEDLFKMDHLTTRMRRHAEGLIILSGSPPGRSWSAPVKLVDVMRGAVAEVEDYARVTVSTQSRAALAGSAVTDVIHLLAELIENATTLSPPFTQVRVSGETVANGFAIEVEDRGLGLTPDRVQELNERLANPPDINPANTEQLGLFVVGQLARRHGIRVVLRPSPYGGTTAVALVPLALIVEDGPAAITSGTPGSRAPAAAGSGANGSRTSGAYGNGSRTSGAYGNGSRTSGAYGNGSRTRGAYGNGSAGGAYGTGSRASGAYGTASAGGFPGTAADGLSAAGGSRGSWTGANDWTAAAGSGPNGQPGSAGASFTGPAAYGSGEPAGAPGSAGPAPAGAGYPSAGPRDLPDSASGSYGTEYRDPGKPTIRISGALRHPSAAGGFTAPGGPDTGRGPGTPESGTGRWRHGAEEVPVVTDVPASRPPAPPAPSFDVFTPLRRPGPDDTPGEGTRQGNGAYPGDGAYPGNGPRQGNGTYPGNGTYQDGASLPGGNPYPGGGYGTGGGPGNDADAAGGADAGVAAAGDSAGGGFELPRRVRQASLAPQLRASAAASGAEGPAAVPPATAASLTDMRNTLSAMQRGWKQGREQTQRDTEGETDGN